MDEKIIDCPSVGETNGDNHRRVQPNPSFFLVEVRSKTDFMHLRLVVNKRIFLMWLPVS